MKAFWNFWIATLLCGFVGGISYSGEGFPVKPLVVVACTMAVYYLGRHTKED